MTSKYPFEKIIVVISLICVPFIISCKQPASKKEDAVKKQEKEQAEVPTVIDPRKAIPEIRTEVRKDAVSEYEEKVENPLNDWWFRVRIYETPKTFHYLLKLEYEEIRGTDTFKIPNFGVIPQPLVKPGGEKYSCIIGFLDKDNKFREYKKVYVKNNVLKVTAIKHYGVSESSK